MRWCWHKSLTIIPIDTNSDHYCAIQVQSVISIIGVYLPSANAPSDEYKEYLTQLEGTVASLQEQGKVLIVGDFNAHILFQSNCGYEPPGVEVANWLNLYHLYPVSLTSMRSQSTLTILVLIPLWTILLQMLRSSSIVSRCWTAEGIPENVSDHLAISIMLHFDTPTEERHDPHSVDRIDWKQALADDMIGHYQCGVQLIVGTHLDLHLNTVEDIEES